MTTAVVFDLTNDDDVNRLAAQLGWSFNQAIVPIVRQLTQEQQVVFYGFLFGAPFGGMLAAIGLPAATAVMDVMRDANAKVQSELDSKLH